MSEFARTERTEVHRLPKRGNYDRETVHRILDEALVCHVGFVVDGQPFVIPTGFGRDGDTLYIHGSAASRMLGAAAQGIPVCITVTLMDALVLARSAFHHSVNYRSVVNLGKARIVEADGKKLAALRTFTEHIVPGRWNDVRKPSPQEMRATLVLAVPLDEVSAKIRTGPPVDDDEDYALPIWAGLLPLRIVPGAAEPDPRLQSALPVPAYVQNYRRG
jgi:nitroimidazol reductase NimA-like FMN-containing flavoprotein (pyridoxamine 5'-phosphate oxidase superfamily)